MRVLSDWVVPPGELLLSRVYLRVLSQLTFEDTNLIRFVSLSWVTFG